MKTMPSTGDPKEKHKMECEICKKGMQNGVSLIRQNQKGVDGIWRCVEHNNKPIDKVTKLLIDELNYGK